MNRVWNLYDRWVKGAFARPGRAAAALALVVVPALVLTIQFFGNIHAELQELLPPTSRVVKSLEKIHGAMGGKSNLIVIADGPDADANRRFIDELGHRIDARNFPEIRFLRYRVTEERDWGYERAPMLMSADDFDAFVKKADETSRAGRAAANPFLIDFEDSGQKKGPDWESLRREVHEKTDKYDRYPRGYLESSDGTTVVAIIWLKGSETDYDLALKLHDEVNGEIQAIRPAYPGTLRVAFNGEVENLIEEHKAILADLSLSSVVVLLLVGTVIILYFRSFRALLAVILSIVPGLLVTFALGRLTVGGLNSNTAFLGSIIAGNGINYPLLLLAYYRKQPAGLPPPAAFSQAARLSFAGTLGAAVTSSAAYGGLALSDFRGFSQFGWLGLMGMVTVWFFSMLTVPLMVALLKPARAPEGESRMQRMATKFFARRGLSTGVTAAAVLLAVVGVGLGVRSGEKTGVYEMNLRAMRNRESLAHGGASWDPRMNQVFGVWLNPVVGLVDDPSQREEMSSRLKTALLGSEHPMVERVETLATFVPPLDEQERRLTRLRKLQVDYAKVRGEVPADLRDLFDRWFTPRALTPIRDDEVPGALREPFAENSSRADRTVLVYPSLRINYDDGSNVIKLADKLNAVDLPEGSVVGGGFLFMAEVLRLVHQQAAKVVAIVCLLVGLALLPVLWRRPWRIPLTIATTVVVAFGSQALMLALGVRVNLLNFAAIPITIGVGSDYVVNLFGAMDAFKTDARGACARMGGAIFLCSMTTVIGYFSLVLAQSGALRTFGWSAILGEVMAVLAVLLVFPTVSGLLPRKVEKAA